MPARAVARLGRTLAVEVEGAGEARYVATVWSEHVNHVLIGSVEGIGSASVATTRSALARLRGGIPKARDLGIPEKDRLTERVWLGLHETEEEYREQLEEDDEGWFPDIPPTSPALLLEGDRLLVRVEVASGEKPDIDQVRHLLTPFFERRSAVFELAVVVIPAYEGGGFTLTIDIDRRHPRGSTVRDLWTLGDEARALVRAADGDEIPRTGALDLICAGRWDLFKGHLETEWLEAKGDPYDHLEENLGKSWPLELAKDVATFANAPHGGIIVIGMVTNDRGDGDVIEGYKEFDLKRVKASTYRKYIAQFVYPRVEGFEVRRIEGKEGHGLAALVIPAQPESSKPFLVQGIVGDRKTMGAHILLPVRREDDTALMDAGDIHARLRLGEQVIRGEKKTG
jgi:hypothetical protein